MRLSQRMDQLAPYLFVEINKKIAEKRARGEEVISFGIGDPDIPTPANIIDKLCEAARDPANHRYPETDGLPVLRQAIAGWYKRRFGVTLDPNTEVLPLIGSKEGIGRWCPTRPTRFTPSAPSCREASPITCPSPPSVTSCRI